MQNLVHETIPAAVIAAVKEAVLNARDKIAPYVVGLTDEQRETLFKMGDKSYAYVAKVADYLVAYPDYTPRRVDVDAFRADLTLHDSLMPLRTLAQSLVQMLDDTLMAAGSDMMETASAYYRSVQDAAEDGESTAKTVFDELKKRYPGANRRNPDFNTPE